MKFKKSISILVIIIILLSLIASTYGIFSIQGPGQHKFKTLHSQTVEIYGRGLYQNDSVSMAAQAKAQDIVTLFLGIPLLIVSLYLYRKGLLKGNLLLTGTLGYFLYTYTSYSFVGMYNSIFLIYAILMSAGFYAFVLSMMSFDIQTLKSKFSERLPVKFIGSFLIFVAIMVGLMWLGIIVPPLINGTVPSNLEHYTTLVIQAMDLGFVIPTAILSGVLLIKRKSFGYLLASVIAIKEFTMLTALTAMIVGQILAGIYISYAVIILFPAFNLLMLYVLVIIMKNVNETRRY